MRDNIEAVSSRDRDRSSGSRETREIMNIVDHELCNFGDARSTAWNELLPDHCLVIDGMMCQKNCGSTVEKALLSVPGVTKVIVSFQNKAMIRK